MIDKDRIRNAVREILIAIGENPDRDGLLETPARVANMYEEIFIGLHKNPIDEVKIFKEKNQEEIILVRDIPVYSMCEHHLLPFHGKIHVAYIPDDGRILGLSKFGRVVDIISKKPQLQERLTNEVADLICEVINPKGVAVIMEAEHLCMTMRGIKKMGSKTETVALRGTIKNDFNIRNNVISLIKSC
ncbi:GTP cyclohydrolase I FolE [Abyssisolibacter fermentans]|uniref:GTP cyclohydrolase I FolE n=1 Tax=Abyssisolibacter fermentans TaxID=1766203 RepID=UPI000833F49F|nr:GTP cyclohydrolase I FolE [Abyssisolibacter fermentans]